jgi:hypothetical protein
MCFGHSKNGGGSRWALCKQPRASLFAQSVGLPTAHRSKKEEKDANDMRSVPGKPGASFSTPLMYSACRCTEFKANEFHLPYATI